MKAPFAGIAQYYDLLYSNKDYAGEAQYVSALLAEQGVEKASLLNLGCGTGRHDVELVKLGWKVHGVDLSAPMIERAVALQKSTGLSDLSFSVGDARSVRLGTTFDAIVSLFHVASYQATDADVAGYFATIAHHLKDDGVLLFDFWHSAGVLSDPPATRVKRLEGRDTAFIRLAEPDINYAQNLVTVNYSILARDNHQLEGQHHLALTEQHHMRHFSVPELRAHLSAAGLKITDAHAWMHPQSPIGQAWYGCVVARKSK